MDQTEIHSVGTGRGLCEERWICWDVCLAPIWLLLRGLLLTLHCTVRWEGDSVWRWWQCGCSGPNAVAATSTTHMLNKECKLFKLATSINRSHLVFEYDKLITGQALEQLDWQRWNGTACPGEHKGFTVNSPKSKSKTREKSKQTNHDGI